MAEQVDIIAGRRPRRHHAPRPLPGRADAGLARRRRCTAPSCVEERHRHRYEVNNHYREQIADAGPASSRARRPTARSSSTSSSTAPSTRSTSARRRTPSCGRARTTRTRCSPGSSRRPSSARTRAAVREVDEADAAEVVPSTDASDAARACSPTSRRRRRSRRPRSSSRARSGTSSATTFDYDGSPIVREYVAHTGAVARARPVDDEGRVLLIKQYRHPIRSRDWELPAGLLDVEGEEQARRREARARRRGRPAGDRRGTSSSRSTRRPAAATRWSRSTTPPASRRRRRRSSASDEEADIEKRWVPLDEIVDGVLGRTAAQLDPVSIAALAAVASR